jgi:hypothetical protein
MRGLLADVNCEGYVRLLTGLLLAQSRRELWDALSLRVFEFDDLALRRSATDREVWLLCEDQELVLITGNRNARDEDSLEVVMRQLNEPESLPIVTISNPRRVFADSGYANRIADRLLETLYDIANYRGAGRLYLP